MTPFHVHYFQLLEEEWLHSTCIRIGTWYSVSHDDQVNREQTKIVHAALVPQLWVLVS